MRICTIVSVCLLLHACAEPQAKTPFEKLTDELLKELYATAEVNEDLLNRWECEADREVTALQKRGCKDRRARTKFKEVVETIRHVRISLIMEPVFAKLEQALIDAEAKKR